MKKLRLSWVGFSAIELLFIIAILVAIGLAGYGIAKHTHKTNKSSQSSQFTLHPESAAVQKVYKETSDSMANRYISVLPNADLFSTQPLASNSRNETNEVNTLYCFSASISSDSVSQIITSFNDDSSATWGPTTITVSGNYISYDGNGSDNNTYVESLQSELTSNGLTDIEFGTGPNVAKPITTSNPNYYPSGTAKVDLSTTPQADKCTDSAKNKQVDLTGKELVSLSIDLSDSDNAINAN